MRKIAFLPDAFDDFGYWAKNNAKTYARIVALIKDIERNLGKEDVMQVLRYAAWLADEPVYNVQVAA